jgi:hypothetical protein
MRLAMTIGGALLAVVGALTIFWGALTAAAVGSDEWIDYGPHPYSTTTSALVFKVGDTKDEPNFQNSLVAAATSMRVREGRSVRPGEPIFIGIGRSEDVDDYLAGVEYDFVTEAHFEPNFDLDIEPRDGTGEPGHPGDQHFWISQAQGEEDLSVSSDLEGGLRVVIMNADASPDVEARATVGVRVPWLFFAGLGGMALGGFLILAGALIVRNEYAHRAS